MADFFDQHGGRNRAGVRVPQGTLAETCGAADGCDHVACRFRTLSGRRDYGIGILTAGFILAIALLIFGSNKLPKLARSLGQAQREFKAGIHEPVEDQPPVD